MKQNETIFVLQWVRISNIAVKLLDYSLSVWVPCDTRYRLTAWRDGDWCGFVMTPDVRSVAAQGMVLAAKPSQNIA